MYPTSAVAIGAILFVALSAAASGAGSAPAAPAPKPVKNASQPTPSVDAPAPQPAETIRPLLAEAQQLLLSGRLLEGAARAEAAAKAALEAGDLAGQAEAALIHSRAMGAMARREEVVKDLETAARLWEQLGDGPGQLAALGPLAYIQADPQRVREYSGRAIAIGDSERKRPAAAGRALLSLGVALVSRSHIEIGADVLDAAIRLRRVAAPGSADLAEALAVGAQPANFLRRRDKAEQLLRESLSIYERVAPEGERVSGVMMWLGALVMDRYDFPEARAFLTRALALSEKNRPGSWENARILTFLGVLTYREQSPEAALKLHQRASELYQRIPPAAGDYTVSLLNEGLTANHLSQDGEAEKKLRRSHALLERQQPGSIALAMAEDGLGLLDLKKNDFPAAEQHFRAALEMRERLYPDGIHVCYSLGNVGASLLYQNRLAEAETVLSRGWKIFLRVTGEFSDPQSMLGFGAETHWLADGYCATLARLGRPREALLVAEQARGRALERLSSDRREVPVSLPAALRQRLLAAVSERTAAEAALTAKALQLARSEAVTAGIPVIARPGEPPLAGHAALEQEYSRARDTYGLARAAEERLRTEALPGGGSGGALDAAGMEAALRQLPVGTVYLCFKEQPDATLLLLAERTAGPSGKDEVRVELFRTTLTRAALAEKVARFAAAVAASSGESNSQGRELFRELLPGGAAARVRAARRLLISPEGSLWQLPFAALVDAGVPGPPRYLGLTKPLALTPSLANFRQSRNRARPRAGGAPLVALAVGDPQFTGAPVTTVAQTSPYRSFLLLNGRPPAPLPDTRADAEAVAKLYGAAPLLGRSATEAAVRARLPLAHVVHLATHGYLSPRWALGSGVLLSDPSAGKPANTRPDTRNDGALQAWEIMSELKLKADLVVLAACETARGETIPGEGLIGLTRALQAAGARSVVTGQWRVRDDATRVLMVQFHQRVRKGVEKDEALRQAMVEVKKQPRWSHPYYWAGFVLTGDPGAL